MVINRGGLGPRLIQALLAPLETMMTLDLWRQGDVATRIHDGSISLRLHVAVGYCVVFGWAWGHDRVIWILPLQEGFAEPSSNRIATQTMNKRNVRRPHGAWWM